jgi:predicted dehydrogenase
MKIGVIGLGYWGPNIVRNLLAMHHEVCVFDREENSVRSVHSNYPDAVPVGSLDDILADRSIEAVALAVPVTGHCDLIIHCLQARKHVFVEKPMCSRLEEAKAIAQNLDDRVLMVGHITQFSKGIEALTGLVCNNEIGDICRYSFIRTHFGPMYRETDVLTEVAAHDVAILVSLASVPPTAVQAWGTKRLRNDNPDAAHIVLQWNRDCTAQIDVQWSSVVRRREIEIEGTKGTLVFRAGVQPEELLLYDHEAAFDALRTGSREIDAKKLINLQQIPIPSHEPLRQELSHFVQCIERKERPKTDFEFACRVVSILEAARHSMQSRGSVVELK